MNDYKILLEKFWNNAASDTEKLQLYKIILEDEEAIKLVLQQEFKPDDKNRLTPGTSHAILETLHQEIGIRASRSIDKPRNKSWGLFRWAAALLVVCFVSFVSWRFYTVQNTTTKESDMLVAFDVISNNGADVKDVVMSDGTSIRLYPQSTIQFKKPFHLQPVRSIRLKGKADFKVRHDAAKTFEVIAGNIRTTDIGTEFCIQAPDEHTFNVALKEGCIRIAAMPNSGLHIKDMILQPGDEVHWDDTGKKMIHGKMAGRMDAEALTQNAVVVVKERLVFDKTLLSKVFSRLEARESKHIAFKEEEIKELTFTGTIESSDSIETALNIICNLNGLYYQKTKWAFVVAKIK